MSQRRLTLGAARALIAMSMALPVWSGTSVPACASESNHAGVVVQLSANDERTYCLSFESQSLSGIEALRATGLPLVTKSNGSLGEFVCKIGGVGTEASNCPASDNSYWVYWHFQDGRWGQSGLGASSSRVHCGGVDGWTWYPQGNGSPPSSTTMPACLAGSCPSQPTSPPETQSAPRTGGQSGSSSGDTTGGNPGDSTGRPSGAGSSVEVDETAGRARKGTLQDQVVSGDPASPAAPPIPEQGTPSLSAGPDPTEPTVESISLGPASESKSSQRGRSTAAAPGRKSSATGGYLLFAGLMAALLALRIYIGTTRRR
ncbi:MAG: hypothetical protein ACR2FO_06180 [Actinomycetota bacterium]